MITLAINSGIATYGLKRAKALVDCLGALEASLQSMAEYGTIDLWYGRLESSYPLCKRVRARYR